MNKKSFKEVFEKYPNANELYIDANGKVWINRDTAENQSNGKPITVIKRKSSKTN